MPLIRTRGSASARGFGFSGGSAAFEIQALVVAGGGAGCGSIQNSISAGGGGAGGYRNLMVELLIL